MINPANAHRALMAVAAEFLAESFPAWTAAGVTELSYRAAVIEISCVAVAGE